MNWFQSIGIVALSLMLASGADARGRWYVNASAEGSVHNGLAWQTAFIDLQNALDVAQVDDEIWVATGTYFPSRETERREPSSRAFQLKDGVSLYGGFVSGAGSMFERDPVANVTVLSGDFNGDDTIVFVTPSEVEFYHFEDNAWHVVIGADSVLDGFTVTGGYARSAWPLPFETMQGGGILNVGNELDVRNTTFHGNLANMGGGVYNEDASVTFEHCTFIRNFGVYDIESGYGQGGGIFNENSAVDIRDCEFFENTIVGSYMHVGVGGAIAGGTLTIARTSFERNGAFSGGAIRASGMTLTDCTFIGNAGVQDGSGGAVAGSDVLASRCDFIGNWGDDGCGALCTSGMSTLVQCRFIGNSGEFIGGAINNGGNLTLIGCLFDENFDYLSSGASIRNSGHVNLFNCTLGDPLPDWAGVAVYNRPGATFVVRNSVIWPRSKFGDVFGGDLGGVDVEHSIVRGGYPGIGNLGLYPQFIDDDLRLAPGSPAIDAGDNAYVLGILRATMADLDGNFRLVDDPTTPDTGVPVGREPIVDLGAYEFQN